MIDLSAARHIQSRSGHARPKPCSLYGVTCLPVSVGGAKAEVVGGDVSQRGQGVAGATHTERDEGADPAGERQAPLKPLARQFLDGVSRHVPSRWGWLAGRANILTGAPSVRLLHPKLFSCLLQPPAARWRSGHAGHAPPPGVSARPTGFRARSTCTCMPLHRKKAGTVDAHNAIK